MGIKVATDNFQAAMAGLFNNLEGVIVYIDNIIIIGSASFQEHMKLVGEVLRRLEYQGLQLNPLKNLWGQAQVEYLGFLITWDDVKP